jgi:hypothetical protein
MEHKIGLLLPILSLKRGRHTIISHMVSGSPYPIRLLRQAISGYYYTLNTLAPISGLFTGAAILHWQLGDEKLCLTSVNH